MNTSRNSRYIRFIAQFGILLAIEAIVCFTPLGSLPAIGPIVATLMMIPVVVTAVVLGPAAGTLMGFFAGLFSFLWWTFTPALPIAFVFTPFYSLGEVSGNFWSLVICFVPRTLGGTVAGLLSRLLAPAPGGKREIAALAVSGGLGSLVNTIGVLGGIFLFFGRDYASAVDIAYNGLMGLIGLTVLTSGIPEAVLAAVVAAFVCRPIRRMIREQRI